ncbi:hypothetical protein [Segetibacter sp.]|jgi:hypothetical protein|uniref:hypothetical protein n=1 Tax=Segetibacter sp. TaxID=2231182 RepID=UPI00261F56E6|nr:hypothetical protein [Segetibacter sp.]MCW3081099.1 hypothetical protein [Segetibacter sp.]
MADDIKGVDLNITNPNNPGNDQAPVDPSNTSDVGQKVEQGVVDTKAGISEQSSEWEDMQERNIPPSTDETRVENYIKDPSPEENNIENEQ